jgi:hypothetical protein
LEIDFDQNLSGRVIEVALFATAVVIVLVMVGLDAGFLPSVLARSSAHPRVERIESPLCCGQAFRSPCIKSPGGKDWIFLLFA